MKSLLAIAAVFTVSGIAFPDEPTAKPEEKSEWVALDLSTAFNVDIISTAQRLSRDEFNNVHHLSWATAKLIEKHGRNKRNSFGEPVDSPGLPDDGRVKIPTAQPPGFFQVRITPQKNAILITEPKGRQPKIVNLDLPASQQRPYARLSFLHGGGWADGVVQVTVRYYSGNDDVVKLQTFDWFAKARTKKLPPTAAVAVDTQAIVNFAQGATRQGDPCHKAEMIAENFEIDPYRTVQSLTFAYDSRPTTIAEEKVQRQWATSQVDKFMAAIFAVSALPVENRK